MTQTHMTEKERIDALSMLAKRFQTALAAAEPTVTFSVCGVGHRAIMALLEDALGHENSHLRRFKVIVKEQPPFVLSED